MLRQFPTRKEQFGPPLTLALLAMVLFLLPNSISMLLEYHSVRVSEGEVWRLITAHLLHTNIWHLLLNILGLGLLWALHGDYYNWRRMISLMLVLTVLCSTGIFLLSPDMQIYVGLSGVLHGIFVWGAIEDIKHKMHSGWALLVGVWVKVYFEQIEGASQHISELIEASVAVDAHLYGALAGLLYAVVQFLVYMKKAP